ncbi:SusC/RagA family TonB-linked outer membrane protein [Carboxylicivirga marina]|uniref:TonB-dependent receptor n=1 Tax=Carboxylicivirga marina TaxID=2800988 RepID=A0ABS1HLY9_9BACT|nr:TonB-dependent receptor [Carboxylicivirga marina]MBK3518278.1 TonB-dependent receptor [Carboxylicivirga marina]
MKKTKKARGSCFSRLMIIAMVMIVNINAFSQEKLLTGNITDTEGLTIPGVTVMIDGTTLGTITDIDGNYSLKIPAINNPVIVFSFIGMKTQRMSLAEQARLDVVMVSDLNEVDEVVVVGYGTQKRISVTGAVNTIKTEDLAAASSSSVATALTGRLPGTVVVQSNGVAGSGASEIRIRGGEENPLILVDGVERGFQDLDPDEIESVTTLKDASATAVYGIRGGDGVIIITTKRGKDGPAKISVKTEFGLIQQGQILNTLNSYDYARLMNEALANDGNQPVYTAEDIELFRTGEDPLFHPNNSWFDEMTNEFGHRQRYTVNMSGGHQKLRYFTSVGYIQERDIYKDYDVGYDDESKYKRYNLRTNLDIDLTSTTVLSVNVAGQFSNRHMPNTSLGGLTTTMFKTPSDAAVIWNDKIIRVNDNVVNDTPFQQLYDNGYRDNYSNKLQFSAKLKQNLNFITKGLSFDGTFSYDHGYGNDFVASKNIPVYEAFVDANNPENINLRRFGSETKLGESRSTSTKTKTINVRLKMNYKRSFGRHNIGGVGVFTTNEVAFLSGGGNNPTYVPRRYVEAAGRVSYNFADKYFLEFNGGYNGSENFAPGETRFGFFPAISGGWVLSNEAFFPKNDILSFVKLRGSYGTTGNDKVPNRFAYYDAYNITYGGGYLFGVLPDGQGQALQTKVGNPNVSWSTSYQKNLALETRWFDGKLKLQADVFETEKKDILITPNNIAGIIGAPNNPPANIGEQRIWGYELQANYKTKIGAVDVRVFGNFSTVDKEWVFKDEIPQDYAWQERTGRHPSAIDGMVFDGFYSQDDIDYLAANNWVGDEQVVSSGYVGESLQAGDLKYVDLNGDGVTNDSDMKVFENLSIPATSYGFGTNLAYKGWSLNVFFQGVDDVTYNISGFVREPFISGVGNGSEILLNRWTSERAAAGEKIEFPRLTSSGKHNHNYKNSDFWFRDASYIRLKNMELAYRLKGKKLKDFGISSVRMYLSGTNLMTWTDLDFVDPETKSGSSALVGPNKVYTMGVNVSF